MIDLDVEVARVAEDRAVLHRAHVLFRDHVLVAGRGAEDVADRGCLLHRHHLVAVHQRLERAHRVDLGDDHVRAEPLGAHRDAAPDPAVAGYDEALSGEQDVGRADDPVDRRLARAVPVVEEMLRARIVHRDHREREGTVGLHRLQPDHARGRLLHPGDDVAELLAAGCVEHADHVCAVVHRQLRLVVDRGLDVLVVGVVVLALDREHRDVELLHERGSGIILGRERVRRAQHDVGSAGLEGAHQVRGLRGHVQARGDAVAGERLLGLEALADRGQHRHLPVRPHDAPQPLGCEREILYVVALRRRHSVPPW